MPVSSQACPISCLNIDIMMGMEDMYGLNDMNSPCQHFTGYCYYFKPNLQMLWPIMESSICHHASGSHQVTWWQKDYMAPFHFDEYRGSFLLECKHTLETFLAHTALASEAICGRPNVLFTNGIPRVFTAPDQGNHLTAKEIHQWAQAHGIKSSPPGNSWAICKKVWRSETIFPLSGHVRPPPGHLGFFMSLNWNARKSSILSSEVTDPDYWRNIRVATVYNGSNNCVQNPGRLLQVPLGSSCPQ